MWARMGARNSRSWSPNPVLALLLQICLGLAVAVPSLGQLLPPTNEGNVRGSFFGVALQLRSGEDEFVWPPLELNARLVIACILGAIGACLSSAGGVGGGGLYVPLFNLLLGFDSKTAAALSNFMISGGGVSNMAVTVQQPHPEQSGRPLIDYDAALILLPNMLLGISLGVICNVMFPGWLITTLLTLTLIFMTNKSVRGALKRWAGETRRLQNAALVQPPSAVDSGSKPKSSDLETPLLVSRNAAGGRKEEAAIIERFPWQKLATLVFVWFAFFAVQVLRGGEDSQSPLSVQPCGLAYWLLTASQIPIAVGFTFWAAYTSKQDASSNHETEERAFAQRSRGVLPALALLAGALGGMLGIGGGMILNPVLLEIGMHPQVTAATVIFLIFFASSMSVVQYWLLGRIPLDYALLFAAVSFLFSMVGQIVVQRLVAKYGRPSIVVFIVSAVIGVSAIAMACFGGYDIVQTYLRGGYMGFHTPC